MRKTVQRADPTREYFTDENCHILELSNSAADAAVSIARARVTPGATTRWHRLAGIVERYVIIEGRGSVEVGDGAPEIVGPGDVVHIPAQCRQRITNTGDGDLVFLAICTPRFVQSAYEDVESTRG
jgi:mannose-6-phosphate isomerase-like protein (cupin superfamily)